MITVRSYREILQHLRTPFGRMELWKGFQDRIAPILCGIAGAYRRSVLRRTCIIAITGTYGKTTTQRAIAVALGMKPDEIEKSSTRSGVAKNLFLTPPWRRFAPIEIGIFGPGQMIRFARMMQPDMAIVTSIGTEHQREFKTLENTCYEKSQLLNGISPLGVVILNGDDPNVNRMREKTTRRVITYGFNEGNELRASNWQMVWPEGSQFQVNVNGAYYSIRTHLHGRHMAYPVLSALAVAYAANQDMRAAVKALEHLTPARGRMRIVELPNHVRVIQDDYKSGLETMEAALDFLHSIPDTRRIVVLGKITDPPSPQRNVYQMIGHRFGTFADFAFLMESLDRSYATGARAAGMDPKKIFKYNNDLKQAAETLKKTLQPGDVLLIKGRLDEHLERITLWLSGLKINCWRPNCRSRAYRCENCPMREKGWQQEHEQ